MIDESIFNGAKTIIPMADVQHIVKMDDGYLGIVTKHTTWNYVEDQWENPIVIHGEEAEKFLGAWCHYRYEVDIKPTEHQDTFAEMWMELEKLLNVKGGNRTCE